MGTTTQPVPAITIDVLKDLDSSSDLKSLISANGNVVLQLASTLAQHAGKPVSAALGVSSPTLTLTAFPKWTAGPVTFSLKTAAKCAITIAAQGEALGVATKVDDPNTTSDVQLAPVGGMTYVNIDFDFDLRGEVAGTGTVYGLTISGKVSRSTTTTFSFCQPVPSDTETVAALKMAFSGLIFPTGPDCAARMISGSSCRMSFDGALDWKLDLSYGLADFKLSAPSAPLVQSSVATCAGLSLPIAEVKAGAMASVKYSHTDHFGLIVEKQDSDTALLYLVRASNDETDASAGIKAGITTMPVSVTVNPSEVQQAVQMLTKSSKLARSVLNTVTPQLDNFEATALAKLTAWIADANGDAGLSIALSKQTGRTTLFHYRVDLAQPAVAAQSWQSLLSRGIADPTKIAGFTLLPGSGVAEQFKQATTLQFHFFNLYKHSDVKDFFDNCSSQLAADGTIQLIYDIGIEAVVTANQAVDTVRFHFSATATEAAQANIGNAEIDLILEIAEKSDPRDAAVLANVLGIVDKASLQPAINAMSAYASSHPAGTLSLIAVLKPSAYGRLSYSPFSGGNPQQDQTKDEANWNVIHQATLRLMGTNFAFLSPFTYSDWRTWNVDCINGGPGVLPNRRRSGPPTAVPSTFWKGNPSAMVDYFFRASADGMNLFEDSVTLATATTTTEAQWQDIKAYVIRIVKGDANIDYSKPIAAAILSQAARQGAAQTTVTTAQAKDASTFTTTLTIS